MQISYLADYPEFILPLAEGRLEQYRELLPNYTLGTHVRKLEAHLNRDSLPIAWVAHSDNSALGTAALRVCDLEGREDLTPWLGGVYVLPKFRRRGIGTALSDVVERKAATLGVRTLYLFTLDQQHWYGELGWLPFQPCKWCGQPGDIMVKSLGAA
jgi:N-acetylglutamate synthase-like GNAT family acetyltransferase